MRGMHNVDLPAAVFQRFPVSTSAIKSSPLSRMVGFLGGLLLVAALLYSQALIGGTRLLFAFPAYGLLAVLGVLAIGWVASASPSPEQICLWSAAVFFGYIELRAAFSPVAYLARFDVYSVLAGLIVYLFTSCIFTSAKARMA